MAGVYPENSPHGIACPKCGCKHHFVLYKRAKGNVVVRRKECRHCGSRLFTRETLQTGD